MCRYRLEYRTVKEHILMEGKTGNNLHQELVRINDSLKERDEL